MHSAIYSGQVSHSRKAPRAHAFRYRVYMAYLDLAELDSVFAGRWFWSTRRPAPIRFRRSDYFGDPQQSLDEAVRGLVQKETGRRPRGPIRVLTNLACFGYCFNPLTVYYCFDEKGERPETIVAEVRNTPWGERHCYVLHENAAAKDDSTLRFAHRKQMHVSPFMDMDMEYRWRITVPGEQLVVSIGNRAGGETLFSAALNLERREIGTATLARTFVAHPLMTFKVMAAIHWQALKLWLKGVPFVSHPDKKTSLQAIR